MILEDKSAEGVTYSTFQTCSCHSCNSSVYAFLLCFPAIRSISSLLPLLPCALEDPASPRSSWYSSDPPGKCWDSRPTSTWLWPLPSRSFPHHGVQPALHAVTHNETNNKQTNCILLHHNVKIILLVPASQGFPQYLGLPWSRFRQYFASSQ